MDVCLLRVLSDRGQCDALITRPEKSYRLWCVVVCDLEASRMRPWPELGRSATGEGRSPSIPCHLFFSHFPTLITTTDISSVAHGIVARARSLYTQTEGGKTERSRNIGLRVNILTRLYSAQPANCSSIPARGTEFPQPIQWVPGPLPQL